MTLAVAMLASAVAPAGARCTSAADQSAFDVGALKSEFSVLASGCPGDEDDYNAFVVRDRRELVRADGVVNAWFKRNFGRAAQSRYDSYITLLANEQSLKGQHEGSQFCERLKPVFAEAAVVPAAELGQFAAAKDLFPIDLACDTQVTSSGAPAGRRGGHAATPARHKKN